MANPFETHGIKHLSPSSLNMWRNSPGIWTLKYLLRLDDGGSPAMWRGSAVEAGLAAMLRGVEMPQALKSPATCSTKRPPARSATTSRPP